MLASRITSSFTSMLITLPIRPTPLPTLVGVHRIWTSSSYRRSSLASLLLDAVASRFIYAAPISVTARKDVVAFSQPTGAGMALARRWTGTKAFKVFVE